MTGRASTPKSLQAGLAWHSMQQNASLCNALHTYLQAVAGILSRGLSSRLRLNNSRPSNFSFKEKSRVSGQVMCAI